MSEFGEYSLADVAAQVRARDAKRFTRSGLPVAGEDELTRYWDVAPHLQERVRWFLDRWADGDAAAWTGETAPAAVRAVSGPLVDQGVAQPGMWRVARVWDDVEFPGRVFQTLRRGWLTTLLKTGGAVEWSEARLGSLTGTQPDQMPAGPYARQRALVVVWRNVAAGSVRAIVESLMALDAVSGWAPVIQGETYAGAWVRISARGVPGEDGTAAVELELAIPDSKVLRESESGTVFESQTADTIANAAAARVVNFAEAGKLKTQSIEKSEFPGLVHDSVQERTATTVVDASQSKTVSAHEVMEADTIRNAVAARVVNFAEVGKIKTQSIEKSEYPDRVHDSVQEREGVAQDTGWVEFDTRGGTAYLRAWKNQEVGFGKEISDAFTAETNNTISPPLVNAYGKEDGHASRMPYNAGTTPDSSPGGNWQVETLYYLRVRDVDDLGNPGTQVQEVSYKQHFNYRSNYNAAITNRSYRISVMGDNVQSYETRPVSLRDGRRIYKNVIRTVPLSFGAWGTAPTSGAGDPPSDPEPPPPEE